MVRGDVVWTGMGASLSVVETSTVPEASPSAQTGAPLVKRLFKLVVHDRPSAKPQTPFTPMPAVCPYPKL